MSPFRSVLVAPLLALSLLPTTPAVAEPAPSTPSVPGDTLLLARTAGEVEGPGRWSIDAVDGGHRVSWTAPTRLPVGSDRPEILRDGLPWGTSTVADDGRSVVVTVPGPAPEVAELDVELSGVLLDEQSASTGEPLVAAPAATGTVLPGDPAAPGTFPVSSSDYHLPGVKVPGLAEPVEMVGHVVTPTSSAATGPRPLVLFLHGRHPYCYVPGKKQDFGSGAWPCAGKEREIPSHLGYDYLQRRLASQGYSTVSVRVNGINAQDDALTDGGADARARVVRAHLAHWAATRPDPQVDLDRVVLVGHSRGGEGVNRASLQVPLDAPYRIVGQLLLAPTDFGAQTAPFVPTVTVLPGCDGDVSDLQGQQYTDLSRGLVAGDTSLKSSVYVAGANHNWFNTEWTTGMSRAPSFDDWGGPADKACGTRDPIRLSKAEQRGVALAYVAAAVRLFTTGDEAFLPLLDGSDSRVTATGDAVVRSHALGGGRVVWRPGAELRAGRSTGRLVQCRGVADVTAQDCGRRAGDGTTPHWVVPGTPGPAARAGLDFTWTGTGRTGRLDLPGPVDLTGRRLDLRTVVDQHHPSVTLRVRLVDADGATALVTPARGGRLDRLPGTRRTGKWWAQDLVVDPGAAAVDLRRIVALELVSGSAAGRVVLLDVASTPATLAPVPARRAPLLDVGRVTRREGDGRAPVTVRVPLRVHGTATTPLRVRWFAVSETGRQRTGTTTLPAGASSGSIGLRHRPDRLHGGDQVRYLSAYVESGGSTDAWDGSLTLREDDPRPRLRLRRSELRVVEGRDAVVRFRLTTPLAHRGYLQVRFVRTPGALAGAADLPARLFDVPQPGARPLHRTRQWFWVNVPRGRKRVEFRLPTRADGVPEAAEHLALRFRLDTGGRPAERTVRVTVLDR